MAKYGQSGHLWPYGHRTICDKCGQVKFKQDHLRWRYSTVIHWEQLVYLAIWKDLNKGKIWTKRKEKNKEIGLYHRDREDGQAFAFWRPPSSAFAPSALRPCIYSMYRRADDMQNRFPVIWTILNSLRAFHHLRTISDHFGLRDDPQYQIICFF